MPLRPQTVSVRGSSPIVAKRRPNTVRSIGSLFIHQLVVTYRRRCGEDIYPVHEPPADLSVVAGDGIGRASTIGGGMGVGTTR